MTSPIRVLVVGPKYPSRNSRGGMATIVGLMRDHRDPRIRIRTVSTYVDDTAAMRLVTAVSGLAQAIWSIFTGQVDVVHVHLAHRGSVARKSLPLLAARLRGVPAVVHAHSYDFAGWFEGLPGVSRSVVRWALPAHTWLVLGQGLVGPYRDSLDLPPDSVRALLNPAPPLRPARPVRPASERGRAAVRAVSLGRLGHRKGTYDVLEALTLLSGPARAALQVVLAGDGEVGLVQAEIERRDLCDVVRARGWLGPAERDALLDEADLFLLPSHAEGLPMALLEAMAAGLVPVATAVGAIGEILDDEGNAVLVDPGDPAALAQAIEALVLDTGRRNRLAAEARRSAARLGVNPWFEELVEVWTAAVRGVPHAGSTPHR